MISRDSIQLYIPVTFVRYKSIKSTQNPRPDNLIKTGLCFSYFEIPAYIINYEYLNI